MKRRDYRGSAQVVLAGRISEPSKAEKVNGLTHCFRACLIRVKVVAGIIIGPQLSRMRRITQGLVEIDHRIGFARCSDPSVDGLAQPFMLGRVMAV
jgi:hypothetical protein